MNPKSRTITRGRRGSSTSCSSLPATASASVSRRTVVVPVVPTGVVSVSSASSSCTALSAPASVPFEFRYRGGIVSPSRPGCGINVLGLRLLVDDPDSVVVALRGLDLAASDPLLETET
ncbi:hypothetical protein NliqN6_1371 [Naganishia liquefaciens]|uniref:Uncharacterized protein n=1 Tax=Naganishia liquefaciens TaxID=104408 RepID=A0A8H3YD61_9TREE|nr:hypothetical protein NliqN6_1371 [Naganishia liquefaciens]